MQRRHRIALFPTLVALALPALALGATPSQRFFEDLLVKDRKTSAQVRELLNDGGGFVDAQVVFADLTGDRRSDAVVQVASGGSAGNVGLYIFSTHGRSRESKLRAVYRKQSLFRSTARVSGRRVLYRVPQYGPGEEVCCPSRLIETELRWDRGDRRFRTTATRELDGEGKPLPSEAGEDATRGPR